MLEALREKSFPEKMLKYLIATALLFPVYTSEYDSIYAPDFVLVNVFSLLFLVGVVLHRRKTLNRKDLFAWGMLGLLAVYNAAALYVNFKEIQWYSSQWNITLPFFVFIALVALDGKTPENRDGVVRFLLEAAVISNLIGVIVYCMNNYGIRFMGGSLGLSPVDPTYYERRFNWIYGHKSQYAFFMLLFLALTMTYRRLFKNKWTYLGTIGLFVLCLVISNTVTSMFAALFIFGGFLVDGFLKKHGGFKLKYLLWLLPGAAVGLLGLWMVSRVRNIFTLGHRTYIWGAAVSVIPENPYGTGRMCGLIPYDTGAFPVYNLHNVFLNLLLQFSIPAGLTLNAMLGLTALTAIKRNFSFTTLGIIMAMLIPMMMDWCMLLTDLPMFLVCVYFLFFYPGRRGAATKAE